MHKICNRRLYFNPLPRKEGDSGIPTRKGNKLYFNPLPRKEGDVQHMTALTQLTISIHSLVKRETVFGGGGSVLFYDFNPLPRKEGDVRPKMNFRQVIEFQSTPS